MNIRTFALCSAAAFASTAAFAQETIVTTPATTTAVTTTEPVATTATTTTTSTNTAGTITEFTPGSSRIVLRSSAGAPVSYTYSKTTTFVDGAGNVVNAETIRPGEPTTVYYAMEAGQPVVSRVVVNRTVQAVAPVTHTESSETTTTTTHRK